MNFKTTTLAAASFAIACAAVPATAAVIVNPGFEDNTLAPWTTFGEDFGPSRPSNGFRLSTGDDANTGTFGVVNDVLAGDTTGTFRGLQQRIATGFSVGETYSLSAFIRLASAETTQSFLELAYVDADGVPIGPTATSAPQSSGFQPYTLVETSPLTVPAGTAAIRVGANIFVPAGFTDAPDFHIFDDFALNNLTPVPEPTGLAAGLVALGGLTLRRRR